MNRSIPWAGALLLSALASSLACADPYYPPGFTGSMPGACGPDCSTSGHRWRSQPPNYWFRPTGEPITPYFPSINGCGPYYVTHPYVRGPRDFFMWRENMEDQLRREQRPTLVP
jgi:hypothetical protein